MKFPEVRGSNLSGKEYRLPYDLEGEVNVVVVAFQQWQQQLVDTWLPALDALQNNITGLRYYEIAALAPYNRLMRAWIDNGMRMGIPDPAVRARTITLYTNLDPFMRELDISDNSNIHTLLLNRSGEILWRTEGPFYGSAFGELIGVLNAQLSAAW